MGVALEPRTCELDGCEVVFQPKRKTQKYCSPQHSTKASNDRRKGVSSLTATAAPGDPVSREEQLEVEVSRLRTAVSRARSQDVHLDEQLAYIREAIDAKRPTYRPAPKPKRSAGTPHRFLLEWSDLHAAEVVSAEMMNGINEYDWSTMLRRHETMRQAVLSFKEHRPYPVEGMHIAALGDMVTGDIHDELRVTNDRAATEASVQLGLDMAEWIESFIPEFPWIQIDAVFGNHGRLTPKPSFKQAFNNWDWVFYQVLAQRLSRYETVRVNVSKAPHLPVMVYDKRILLWHGDGVRTTMPGVPWGGIIRRVRELDQQYSTMGMAVDHYAIGHWHQINIVDQGRVLMNGSVKGEDEYILARYGRGEPAAQSLFTFHPTRGLTDWSRLDLA